MANAKAFLSSGIRSAKGSAQMDPLPTDVATMEPMLSEEANRDLEDIAFELIARANALAGQIHPIVTRSVGDLVRSMNCYYSNFIEGHNTHPRGTSTARCAMIFRNRPNRGSSRRRGCPH
jgi:hypothetical protein